jgi:hypothetical protein
MPGTEFFLPKDVTPSYYRLELEPYLENPGPDGRNFTYKGHVSITIQCHSATNKVSIHAKNLGIGEDIEIKWLNDSALTTVSADMEGNGTTPEAGDP